MKRRFACLLFASTTSVLVASQQDAPAVRLCGHRSATELATHGASRAPGLVLRTELAADHSMLFVFPQDDQRWFWMRSTPIPLDILYFDGNRGLVSVQANVPPCRADPCPSYPDNRPARYVLEFPGGTAERIGAVVGDELAIEGNIGPVQ